MNTIVVVNKILLQIDEYVKKRRARIIDLFRAVDSGGDGTVTPAELRDGLEKIGITATDVEFLALIEAFDPDGSGEIEFSEFVQAVKTAKNNIGVVEVRDDNSPEVVNPVEHLEDYDVASVFELLKRVQNQSLFFKGFSESDLQSLAKTNVGVVEFSEGQILVPEGKKAEWFGIVVSGCLSLQTPSMEKINNGERTTTLGPGDWVNATCFLNLLAVDQFCKDFVSGGSSAQTPSRTAARLWNRGRLITSRLQNSTYDNLMLVGDFDDVLQLREGAIICWSKSTIASMATVRTSLCLRLTQSLIASSQSSRASGYGHSVHTEKTDALTYMSEQKAPTPNVEGGRSPSPSGRKSPTGSQLDIIRKLKIALEQEKEKWKRKFETLKGVLEDQHKQKITKIIKKHKDDFHQELQAATAQHVEEIAKQKGELSTIAKKDDREKIALRAKVAKLTKELQQYKKEQDKKLEEVAQKISSEAKSQKAKIHWGRVRNDMQKSAKARDKFAELMHQGTLKALRNVREEALKALEETRLKLKNSTAQADSTKEALENAEKMKVEMNMQIETLQDLVYRTENEKNKLEKKKNSVLRANIQRRFAAAKLQADKRRNAEALQSLRNQVQALNTELKMVTDESKMKEEDIAKLHEQTESLKEKVKLLSNRCNDRTLLTFIQSISSQFTICRLGNALSSSNLEVENCSKIMKEMNCNITSLKQKISSLEKDIEAKGKMCQNTKNKLGVVSQEAGQLRLQNEEGKRLVISLTSQLNDLQKRLTNLRHSHETGSITGFSSQRKNRTRSMTMMKMKKSNNNKIKMPGKKVRTQQQHFNGEGPMLLSQLKNINLSQSLPGSVENNIISYLSLKNSPGSYELCDVALPSQMSSTSPRLRWLRKSYLLFVNIDTSKFSNLTGWALSNNFRVLTSEEYLAQRKKMSISRKPSGSAAQGKDPAEVRAIIWRPSYSNGGHIRNEDKREMPGYVSESLNIKSSIDAEYKHLRLSQLQEALGVYGYDGYCPTNPPVIVVHQPGNHLWRRRNKEEDMPGVVILQAPLTSNALASALKLQLGQCRISSKETTTQICAFLPQRPRNKSGDS